MQTNFDAVTIIESKPRWVFIDFNELIAYKDLIYFLVWREIKVLYAQTIMGFSWAILQPLIQILMFTVIFGKVAKISTEGIPYILFSSIAIIPWTYMQGGSLVSGTNMLGKVYFPRLIFPLTSILSRTVDFMISMGIVIFVCIYYRVPPSWSLLGFPLWTMLSRQGPLTSCGTCATSSID